MQQIDFSDFKKVEMRVGRIIEVQDIPGSRKLLKLKVDFGEAGVKQAVAGLKGVYSPESLAGKQYVFVTNLKPKKLMGELAEVMILAAVSGDDIVLIKPERDVNNGAAVE